MSPSEKRYRDELLDHFVSGLLGTGDSIVNEAVKNEWKLGIMRATAALFEASVEEKVISRLLQNHWGINESDAKLFLRIEKTVNAPTKKIATYLEEEGYSSEIVDMFIRQNNIQDQLKKRPTLWKHTDPVKLLEQLEIRYPIDQMIE